MTLDSLLTIIPRFCRSQGPPPPRGPKQQEPYFSRFQVEIHLFLELKAARQLCRVNFRKTRFIKDRLEVALGGLVAPLLGLELLLDALAGLAIITWSCDQ